MNSKLALISAVASASIGMAYGASNIVVDNFNTPAFSITSAGTDLGDTVPSGTDTSLTGTVLRDVALTSIGGSGSFSANNDAGYVEWSNGPLRSSNLTISYTFPSQNITGSAFSFLIVGSDPIAASTQVTITTTAGTLTSPVTAVPTTVGLFNILLNTFSGPGNLNFATGIQFSFITASPGADRAIDAFGIDLPQVPEASTYAAVGFMSIAAFGAYRRVRK